MHAMLGTAPRKSLVLFAHQTCVCLITMKWNRNAVFAPVIYKLHNIQHEAAVNFVNQYLHSFMLGKSTPHLICLIIQPGFISAKILTFTIIGNLHKITSKSMECHHIMLRFMWGVLWVQLKLWCPFTLFKTINYMDMEHILILLSGHLPPVGKTMKQLTQQTKLKYWALQYILVLGIPANLDSTANLHLTTYIAGTPKISNSANGNVFLILLPPCEWGPLARTRKLPQISLKVCGVLFSQRLQLSKFAHNKLNTSTHRPCITFRLFYKTCVKLQFL
jgi:hypothetical protein